MSKKGRERRTAERRLEDRENRSSYAYLQRMMQETLQEVLQEDKNDEVSETENQ